MSEQEKLPALHFAGGPMGEPADLEVYLNAQGLIIISANDEPLIEISPLIAKKLRKQLNLASVHPEMANLPDIFVARKILSSKYQPYVCGKIFRAPRSQPNLPISG
ncbi:hypothetical protein [uncultured Desulfosarcina sp.]|uniref:hypothetical protein n=1 Tax=uncultured Desulfosarcina sp. TaxID=218289 RepID=UPI0029C6E52F|nr:hypothetical protein [uncultured Desulfosarcina sp.]